MMRYHKNVLVATTLLMVASNAQSTKPVTLNSSVAPIVDLGYAKFLGYTNATAGINYFRGIP